MLAAQVDPANAIAILEFVVRQFGLGVTLVAAVAACFFWFLKHYHATQIEHFAAQQRESNDLHRAMQAQFQGQLDRVVRQFGHELDAVTSRHEASMRALERQFREHAAGVERSIRALEAGMAAWTELVGSLTVARQPDVAGLIETTEGDDAAH